MRTIAAVWVILALGASGAGAEDLRGTWGIGAGVFGRDGEVSFLRGKSERSAWLFDVTLSQRVDHIEFDSSPPGSGSAGAADQHVFSVQAGPGYRRFTRSTEEFSPYWDIRVRGSYSRGSSGSTGSSSELQTASGAEASFSFGLEYFTPWHFSIAAHSTLGRFSWTHLSIKRESYGSTYRVSGDSAIGTIVLSPILFVRGYF